MTGEQVVEGGDRGGFLAGRRPTAAELELEAPGDDVDAFVPFAEQRTVGIPLGVEESELDIESAGERSSRDVERQPAIAQAAREPIARDGRRRLLASAG
jgi:hypothetical protein